MQPRLPLSSWEHLFIDVTKEDDRYLALHAYLKSCVRPGERVIIFRTHGPKAVQVALTLRALEHNAAPVVGRMTESDRNKTVKLFTDGSIPILVCTEVSIAAGANLPRADHLLNWGFHWSSAQANSREYIARCDKGNGRIVSFVTIADSVTLQHLHTSLGFHMKEVQFDEATKKEAQDKLNESNFASRQEHVRSREQDKLNSLLASTASSASTTSSNNNTMNSLNNTSSSAMGNKNSSSLSSNNNNNNNNNNSNNWLPSRHYVPPTPGEAMKNIAQVMNTYLAIHNDTHRVGKNDDDDDDSTATSDETDDDDETESSSSSSDSDSSDNESSNDSKSGKDRNKKQHKKSRSSSKKISKTKALSSPKKNKKSSIAGPIFSRGDVGLVVSPTRTRSTGAMNDTHGLHGHVSLPKYSTQHTSSSSPVNNNNNNNRSVSRGGAASSSVAKRSSSQPRQQQQQQQSNHHHNINNSTNLCLPRQVNESGKFVVNQQQNVGPFVARAGDEEFVEMIEAEMNLGHVTTNFDDIAGQEEAKRLLEEAVIFPTMMPNFFTDIRRPWKGVLLYGSPGTGKTLLAKACAASAKTTFFAVSPATLTSKWRGQSEKMIRVLFEMARHYSPSTIFIDECDSLCGQRGGSGEHEASLRAKSMLLQEMDGMCADPKKTVVVIGATNHPTNVDSAFLRRFEQRIYIPLPTQSDRESLFRLNTKNILLGDDVKIPQLAAMLEGKFYSGADVTTLIRDAAMRPMRRFFYGESTTSGDSSSSASSNNKNNGNTEAEANRRRQELYRNPQQLEEKLAKLPVLMSDFEASLKHVPSSVTKDQVAGYEQWKKLFSS